MRVVDVKNLAYPMLEGTETGLYGVQKPVVLDLRDFDQIELYEADGGRTLLLIAGIVGVALIVLLAKVYSALHSD